MIKYIALILPVFIYAESLKELIDYASSNNQLIVSKKLAQKSKREELESKKALNYPTIDVGGFYQRLDDRTLMMPGDIYSGYAKISYNIYDGGSKTATIRQKRNELKSAKHDKTNLEKNINIQIVQNFYMIKNLKSSTLALKEKKRLLQAQLDRVKKFYEANLATKDDIDKLQSAYDTNSYEIESLKFQTLSLIQNLSLIVSKEVKSVDNSKFIKATNIELKYSNEIKSMQFKQKSIRNIASSLKGAYLPKIDISDTFSIYEYGRTDSMHPEGLDSQNKLMLSLHVRLFDGNSIAKKRESIRVSANALKQQIAYKKSEQDMNYELAKSRISTNKAKIKSAKSALESSLSAYITIEKKYQSGIVDNIAYLDALTRKTSAKALYEKSLNDLEVAYGLFYFYTGKDLQGFIK